LFITEHFAPRTVEQSKKIFRKEDGPMTEPTADRRTVRTHKLLRQALLALIEEKGLDKITVSDLTSRAEINRGTFYLHYRDVSDLLEQFQSEILVGWSDMARGIDFMELISYAEKQEPYPGLVAIFEYCNRHADFCRVMLGPKGDPSFPQRIKEMMIEKFYHKLSFLDPEKNEEQIPRDYVLAYMSSGNVGLLQHWFQTGQQQSPKDLARIMTRMITQGPLVTLGITRPSRPRA
jgi:AcrR family transcriptional regulator